MINKFSSETAIGIVTCNRPEFLNILLDSLDSDVGDIFVFNAGSDFSLSESNSSKVKEILKSSVSCPTPVGHAKNSLLRKMRHSGYQYLFLIEDDIKIKDNSVFEKYILTAAETGLWAGQLSYGLHGGEIGGNVKKDGTPNIIEKVDYENCKIDVYPQSFQAFTLYHANVLKIIGYFDEFYTNAVEHLDHYYLSFLNGLGNYFWYFPDIEDSWKYIEDIDSNHSESVIRKDPEWGDNVKKAWAWFNKKYGLFIRQIPKVNKELILARLKFIEDNYSRKNLL